jgi:hypothetical protein
MKKMGTPARARGEVKSTTRDPASIPAEMTEKTAYESLEVETVRATSFGRAAMTGSKREEARDVWQTMETSMGVMEMLRKPWCESRVRLRRS